MGGLDTTLLALDNWLAKLAGTLLEKACSPNLHWHQFASKAKSEARQATQLRPASVRLSCVNEYPPNNSPPN